MMNLDEMIKMVQNMNAEEVNRLFNAAYKRQTALRYAEQEKINAKLKAFMEELKEKELDVVAIADNCNYLRLRGDKVSFKVVEEDEDYEP